jgi:hypothetical protein
MNSVAGYTGHIFGLMFGVVPEHKLLVFGVAAKTLCILLLGITFAEGYYVALFPARQMSIHAPVTCVTAFTGLAMQGCCMLGNDIGMTLLALLIGICGADVQCQHAYEQGHFCNHLSHTPYLLLFFAAVVYFSIFATGFRNKLAYSSFATPYGHLAK